MFLRSCYYSNELQIHQIEKISRQLTYLEVSLLGAQTGLVETLYDWCVDGICSKI